MHLARPIATGAYHAKGGRLHSFSWCMRASVRVCVSVCVCKKARWREKCTLCTFLTSTFMLMISLFTLRLPGNIFLILYFTILPALWLNWPSGTKGKEVKRGEVAGFTDLLGRRRQVEELWMGWTGSGRREALQVPQGLCTKKTKNKNSILFLFMRFNLRVLVQRLPCAAFRSLPACRTDL